MKTENTRVMRSSSLAVTFIARQFGVRINADAVEQALDHGVLSNSKEFDNFFSDHQVLTKPRKASGSDLLEKRYLYPCVGVMRSGQAQILVGTKKDASNSNDLILYIDPIDPTAQLQEEPMSQFLEK